MKALLSVFAAALAASLVPAAAEAKLDDSGRFPASFVDTVDDCGFEGIVHTFDGVLVYKLRTIVDNGDRQWLFQGNSHVTETFTNPVNGRWFTLKSNVNHRETDGHHVSGTIWEFSTMGSGASFTVIDANGRVVYRDSGTYRTTFLFDTVGDDQPGGELLSEELTDLNGRFADIDWCDDVFGPLLG